MTPDAANFALEYLAPYLEGSSMADHDRPLNLDSLGRFLLYDQLCQLVGEDLPVGLLDGGLRTVRDVLSTLESRSWVVPPAGPLAPDVST